MPSSNGAVPVSESDAKALNEFNSEISLQDISTTAPLSMSREYSGHGWYYYLSGLKTTVASPKPFESVSFHISPNIKAHISTPWGSFDYTPETYTTVFVNDKEVLRIKGGGEIEVRNFGSFGTVLVNGQVKTITGSINDLKVGVWGQFHRSNYARGKVTGGDGTITITNIRKITPLISRHDIITAEKEIFVSNKVLIRNLGPGELKVLSGDKEEILDVDGEKVFSSTEGKLIIKPTNLPAAITYLPFDTVEDYYTVSVKVPGMKEIFEYRIAPGETKTVSVPIGLLHLTGKGIINLKVMPETLNKEIRIIQGFTILKDVRDYEIRARAYIGDISADDMVNVTVLPLESLTSSDLPPGITVIEPSKDVYMPGAITLHARATDDVALTKLVIRVNGAVVKEKSTASRSDEISATKYFNVGTYTITFEAYDITYKTEKSVTIDVRNVKLPRITSISILSPDKHAYNYDGVAGGMCAYGPSYQAETELLVEATVEKGDYDIAYVKFASVDNIYDKSGSLGDTCGTTIKPSETNHFASPGIDYSPPYRTNVTVWYPYGDKMMQSQRITVFACDVKGFCTWESLIVKGEYMPPDTVPPAVSIQNPVGAVCKEQQTIQVRATDDRGCELRLAVDN